ncbi:gamma-glutamyl-gamma-aminobutyrate hydrolase family protein [Geomicrobium sp. JCM 19038]|uniref:gamma-glutamyl-gamma-aminobutyrate hydrolase family protein n=1 Tax=Geomicrobium sp. JCM 19038 TaxID=1460635 RepID=UPI00045F1EBD|nr:gamma-glutamyl-gamma-aminobutyrate hydrolase family protein [Geomicrobium sp. JCM 19038]GAK08279.1 glutamine amidotransferase [Geomicrobium sp. JCM 19038]
MTKPVIGVTPLYDYEKNSYWMLPGYMEAIELAGGIPVVLPFMNDQASIQQLTSMYDGFLFTGGHDVNPALYGEVKSNLCGEVCKEKDELEYALFHEVLNMNKPAFGICRGLQLMNVALGGSLYQDLPTEIAQDEPILHKQEPPYDRPIHQVSIHPNSSLYDIVQTTTLKVNSYHHQGIKNLAEGFEPYAVADDGLVEAIGHRDYEFVLAVQWHPEFHVQSPSSQALFRAFVDHAKVNMPV